MLSKGGRDIAQYRLNPQNLGVDLLNCAFAALGYILVGNHLQGVSNVVIQFRNPLQPVLQRLVASLYVGQNQEYQNADC